MPGDAFSGLIEQTRHCNEELYKNCQTEQWDLCAVLIRQRAELLDRLSAMTASISPAQIEVLSDFYATMLEKDRIYLAQAQTEHIQIQKQLRHIKRAEKKAIPVYRNHSKL